MCIIGGIHYLSDIVVLSYISYIYVLPIWYILCIAYDIEMHVCMCV